MNEAEKEKKVKGDKIEKKKRRDDRRRSSCGFDIKHVNNFY